MPVVAPPAGQVLMLQPLWSDAGLTLCRTERLRIPPGPTDGGGDAGRVLHHGSAVVRGGHSPVHLPRQQLEVGVRELGPGGAASLPGHQRTEADRPGHLLAHGLLCIHDGLAAGCFAAPLAMLPPCGANMLVTRSKNTIDLCFCFFVFFASIVHSYAGVVRCIPLHGSVFIERHSGNGRHR